jgi:predicted nuclease of predicted toxin-antitoxin system
MKYIIDENLPADIDSWSSASFMHVNTIPGVLTDTAIWKYAIENKLIILTKDVDFYQRYLSHNHGVKVVWFRIHNMKKRDFNTFITQTWNTIEELLHNYSFVIVFRDCIEIL